MSCCTIYHTISYYTISYLLHYMLYRNLISGYAILYLLLHLYELCLCIFGELRAGPLPDLGRKLSETGPPFGLEARV